jgi:hypothetical protein
MTTTHSYAETLRLLCPHCGRPIEAEIWLVVDLAERPDLAERIRAGTLHDVTCPHCQQFVGRADEPLLLYRPGANPPLLFSPAQKSSDEQDEQHATQLVTWLRQALGETWQEHWLTQGLRVVPRPLMASAAGGDAEAARQEMIQQAERAALAARNALDGLSREERAQAILDRILSEQPIALKAGDVDENLLGVLAGMQAEAAPGSFRAQQLAMLEAQLRQMIAQETADFSLSFPEGTVREVGQALQNFIQAVTWRESQQIVEDHPELLSPQTEDLLALWLAKARQDKDANRLRVLEQHRKLLQRCRETGVSAAFREID